MGYQDGNPDHRIDEILAAYDFSNSNNNIFNVTIWHNETYKNNGPLLQIFGASNAVMLIVLVQEKQKNMRMMMKMHGLGDLPYWIISYAYFFILSASYMLCFSLFGSLIVVGYLYVFVSGLLGSSLFERFIQDTSYPRELLEVMEIFPGFSLYHGLYELAQYSLRVGSLGAPHMGWKDINNDKQGMRAILIIMIV